MQPAAQALKAYLDSVTVRPPALAVINNVDVGIETEPAAIKDALVRQAASPVRWVEIITRMAGMGVTHVIECGPGKVLAGLTKRINPQLQGFAIADRASLEQTLAAVRTA
jgi:[acyl-carrier-protein] S-malonyltransferase